MEESRAHFPFYKLRYHKYAILDVMMYIENPDVYKYMFSINKESR